MQHIKKFISDDSTLVATYRVGNLTENEEARQYYPVGEPNHCMSAHIESAIIDFFGSLRVLAKNRASNGGFQIRIVLTGNGREPIYIRTNEGQGNWLLGVEFSEPVHSFRQVSSELDPLLPVQDLLFVLNDLALDVVNQGGVRNLRVMSIAADREDT
ncbi:MAG: hypothetical protein GX483_06230 [Actinomycetaceae bacterium]|nr:hypothetical protein [Actinomycetaceae bacterium]